MSGVRSSTARSRDSKTAALLGQACKALLVAVVRQKTYVQRLFFAANEIERKSQTLPSFRLPEFDSLVICFALHEPQIQLLLRHLSRLHVILLAFRKTDPSLVWKNEFLVSYDAS